MKIYILLTMLVCLLMVNVIAQDCKTTVSTNDAFEKTTVTEKYVVMENKTITINKTVWDYKNVTYTVNQTVKEGNKTKVVQVNKTGKIPTLKTIQVNKTIQVPKTTQVTKYKIDFLGIKILPYQVAVNVYNEKQIQTNKLKDGYYFDEDKGEVYTYGKC